jgi:hypothetical protein
VPAPAASAPRLSGLITFRIPLELTKDPVFGDFRDNRVATRPILA